MRAVASRPLLPVALGASLALHAALLAVPGASGARAAAGERALEVALIKSDIGTNGVKHERARSATAAAGSAAAHIEPPASLPFALPLSRPPQLAPPSPPDLQAAYLAQRQHQAQLVQQAQNAALRGQYEARLLQALQSRRVAGDCRVVLPGTGAARPECDRARDADAITAALEPLGEPPSGEPMVIESAEAGGWTRLEASDHRFGASPAK